MSSANASAVLQRAAALRATLSGQFRDETVKSIYAEAERIAGRASHHIGTARYDFDQRIDRIVTSPIFGLPIMALLLAVVFWLTVAGANVPSAMLASGFFWFEDQAAAVFTNLGAPWWVTGFIWHGVFRGLAWVVSVMLPPMMIFFPLFTMLEDLGYLPRVAFNLDRVFQRVGAHGKQALTMAMGYGCNAAGVIAARVIDSPRERLIAIVTNNFALCNGRWPAQILMATIFIGALAPAHLAGLVATGAVFAIAMLGFALSLLSSWLLSRTLLRGEASTFSLELPPYRPPNLWRTLYTSLIDRTAFVLWRAVVFALPAGAVIWLVARVHLGGESLAFWGVQGLSPLGLFLGLNGVILLAYVIAIPANEIVIPSVLMLTVLLQGDASEAGVLVQASDETVRTLLTHAGWTPVTALCLMLFSLCHNPCSTTLVTIYRETGSLKWTSVSALLPTAFGMVLCALVAWLAGVW